jgi:hypothetical protein
MCASVLPATQNSTPSSAAYQGSDEPLGSCGRQITTSSKTASPGSGTMEN